MRLLNGKREVVAPISAPMLQIVAIPVQESDSTPGPLYSTIAPVPPLTVRTPATLRITSKTALAVYHATTRHSHTFRGGPTANLACEVHADDLGALKFPRNT